MFPRVVFFAAYRVGLFYLIWSNDAVGVNSGSVQWSPMQQVFHTDAQACSPDCVRKTAHWAVFYSWGPWLKKSR